MGGWFEGGLTGDSLPAAARLVIADLANELHFSPASIWEVAIKGGLGRADFQAEPGLLRRGLLDNGYIEISITSEHAAATIALPSLHKDPFDRMLIAQSFVEGITLLTTDPRLAEYPGPIQRI